MDGSTPSAEPAGSLRQVTAEELAAVHKARLETMTPEGPRGIHLFILTLCILVNAIYFLTRSDYFALFVASSFYLNMYYFITLIIPTSFEGSSLPSADLSRIHTRLREIGITSGVTQFTRLFINTLFMNSRALTLGISLIFSIDIVFTGISWYRGALPPDTTALVIVQCAIIVAFYMLVWKMEPFSAAYREKVDRVKDNLSRRRLPARLITGVFIFGFLLAIFLFLTTIILLPGFTVSAFLDKSELQGLGHVFALIAVLAISQYFIIRYIHGITSRAMADRVFDFKEQTLRELLASGTPGSSAPAGNPEETSTHLLESKIFAVRRNSLAGAFPVFVVDLDFSVMMDAPTLSAIKGYVVERDR